MMAGDVRGSLTCAFASRGERICALIPGLGAAVALSLQPGQRIRERLKHGCGVRRRQVPIASSAPAALNAAASAAACAGGHQ